MVYLLLGVCLSVMFFSIFIILKKITFAQYYIAQHSYKEDKQKSAISRRVIQHDFVRTDLDDYEKQLFDDVAILFMQRPPYSLSVHDATAIQDEVLRKMPTKAASEIRHLDLEEWSIYWQLEQQSLEYYIGNYGVFYSHVDRFGQEYTQVVKAETDLNTSFLI